MKNTQNHLSANFLAWLLPLGTACLVALFYIATFSSAPTSDGFAWVKNIDQADWQKIFLPNHLLSEAFIFCFKQLFSIAKPVQTLQLIQLVNTLLSSISVILLFHAAKHWGFDQWIALSGALLWGFSFSLWYFANGEIHHFGMFFLLVIFILCTRFLKQPDSRQVFILACLCALACCFHQEHFLMSAPIVWFIALGQTSRWRQNIMNYCVVFTSFVLCVYSLVAVSVYGVRNVSGFINWLTQFLYLGKGHVMLSTQDHQFFRLIKGSLMSVHYGAQVFVDFLRYSEVRQDVRAIIFFLSFVIFLALTVVVVGTLIKNYRQLNKHQTKVLLGCVIWVVIYKLLNYKLSPESPEYHLVSSLPIVILIMAGLSLIKLKLFRIIVPTALVLSVALTNLYGAVLPWKQYGRMLDDFSKFADTHFQSNDFFVSTESSLDSVLCGKWDCLSIKDVVVAAGSSDGLKMIEDQISYHLNRDARVFVYNVVPGEYALKSMNRGRKTAISAKDFEHMFARWKQQYHFVPIYPYWEGNYSQYYLFNPSSDMLWQVVRK